MNSETEKFLRNELASLLLRTFAVDHTYNLSVPTFCMKNKLIS